ncbi:hypothetical protein, partial [Brevibacillus sp. MCWH]|uniref:hypothetical protein n=1 Tax=Brevibacillus sp. MCWH TaxID=2508871 RepID=UPI001491D44B
PFDGETKKAIVEVIPTYLRKILSSLSGKEEIAFDYKEGVFKTVRQMKKEFDDNKKRTALSAFSDEINEIKNLSKSFMFANVEDRRKFSDGIEKFFLKLAESDKLINPRPYKDKYGFTVDELSDLYDFEGDINQLKLFRQLILSLPKSQQMK